MTLPSFDSTLRTRVVFGAGSLDRVGELAAGLGGHRVLLVTDAGIVRAGHAARAVSRLQAAGLAVTVFDAVRENPTTLDVARGLEVARAAPPAPITITAPAGDYVSDPNHSSVNFSLQHLGLSGYNLKFKTFDATGGR